MVEECGCYLGEDSFLSEEESESRSKKNGVVSKNLEVHGIIDDQGDMEELVKDLQQQWSPVAQPKGPEDVCMTKDKDPLAEQPVLHVDPIVMEDEGRASNNNKHQVLQSRSHRGPGSAAGFERKEDQPGSFLST